MHNSPFWQFIHNIQSCSEDRFLSLKSGWAFQLSATNSNVRFVSWTNYTALPRFELRWLSSFHNFLQILNILVTKPSYSINDIMLKTYIPWKHQKSRDSLVFPVSIKWENQVLAIVSIPLKLNPCQFSILYPLKTQWKQRFYKMETLTRNGLIYYFSATM